MDSRYEKLFYLFTHFYKQIYLIRAEKCNYHQGPIIIHSTLQHSMVFIYTTLSGKSFFGIQFITNFVIVFSTVSIRIIKTILINSTPNVLSKCIFEGTFCHFSCKMCSNFSKCIFSTKCKTIFQKYIRVTSFDSTRYAKQY